MTHSTLSRRSFSKLFGASAAFAALRPAERLHVAHASPAGATVVRLSSNENPYGPSPAALKAMTDNFSLAWRYPDEHADTLADELSRMHGVPAEQVLLGD